MPTHRLTLTNRVDSLISAIPGTISSKTTAPTITLGVVMVWLAIVKISVLWGFGSNVRPAYYATAAILAIIAILAALVLVQRRQLSLPLVLLLAWWGWLFLRDAIDGHYTFSLLVGGAIVVIAVFLAVGNSENFSRWHIIFPLVFLIASLVFAGINPSRAFLFGGSSDYFGTIPFGQFIGIGGHANHFGPVVAFAVVIIVAQRKPGWLLGALTAPFLVALYFSGSDSAIVAMVLAIIIMFFVRDITDRAAGVFPWRLVTATLVLTLAGLWTLRIIQSSSLAGFSTGRTNIWASFVEPSFAAGWFGFSHFPDYSDRTVFDEIADRFQDPHNTLMMTQLTGGYIAIALYVLFWLSVGWWFLRAKSGPNRTLVSGLSVFLLAHGLVESQIFHDGFRVVFPIYALLVAAISREMFLGQHAKQPGPVRLTA